MSAIQPDGIAGRRRPAETAEIGGGASGYDRTDPYIGSVEAAFFDLDKTVIAKASIMAFAPDFRREGLLTRRTMAKGLWTQLVYVHVGASSKKMARIRRSVLSVSRGWDQGQIRRGRCGHADVGHRSDHLRRGQGPHRPTPRRRPPGLPGVGRARGDRRAARPALRSP